MRRCDMEELTAVCSSNSVGYLGKIRSDGLEGLTLIDTIGEGKNSCLREEGKG